MDKIDKFLKKIALKQRRKIEKIVSKIAKNDLTGVDYKKLRGFSNIYRVRVGGVRVIFQKNDSEENMIISIENRKEDTYKFLLKD